MKYRGLATTLFAVLVFGPLSVRAADQAKYRRTRDVIYSKKDGLAFTFDVFTPVRKANKAAVIVMVSGGYFSRHEMINPAYCQELLQRGYTVFMVVHGSQPRFTIPEILDNIHRAVRTIRYHAADYHVDPDRIGATGASAGGHLALMMGSAGKPGDSGSSDPVERVSSKVQAVACFFPPTDFMNFGGPGKEHIGDVIGMPFRPAFDFHELDKTTGRLERITDREKLRAITRAISPASFITADSAPSLMIHGDKDHLVPIQQSELLLAKLKEKGVQARLIVKPGADHGWPEMLKDLSTIVDWFDRYLAGPTRP